MFSATGNRTIGASTAVSTQKANVQCAASESAAEVDWFLVRDVVVNVGTHRIDLTRYLHVSLLSWQHVRMRETYTFLYHTLHAKDRLPRKEVYGELSAFLGAVIVQQREHGSRRGIYKCVVQIGVLSPAIARVVYVVIRRGSGEMELART